MWITKQTENAELVKLIDAASRVFIWTINHADSSEISRIGNLTYIPSLQGFSNSYGSILVSTNSLGMTLVRRPAALSCNYPILQPTFPMFPGLLLRNIQPRELEPILNETLGKPDYIALAQKLGLNQIDMDTISGKLIRSHAESSTLQTWIVAETPLPLYNANGNLKALYCHAGNGVFEVKCFKYNDLPGEYPFLFKPRQSGVWFSKYCNFSSHPWQFSTSIYIAQANPGMGWFCTADGADKLDWEILRHMHSEIIFPHYQSDPLFNRTAFSEILPILTEAKRHNIKMRVRQVKVREMNPMNFYMVEWVDDNETTILEESELKKRAWEQGIKLDPIWFPKPYEVTLKQKKYNGNLPYFWPAGSIALFESNRADLFMRELLKYLSEKTKENRNIVVVIPHGQDGYIQKFLRCLEKNTAITIVNTEILKDDLEFEMKLREKNADVVFFYAVNDDFNKEFERGIGLAIQTELPIAIFSFSKEGNSPLCEVADHTYSVVGNNPATGFRVENMETGEIKKYLFVPNGDVRIEPGTEEDMVE